MTPLENLIEEMSAEEAWRSIVKFLSSGVERAFEEVQRVMCIQPHADDTDVAAGGTIAKLASEGKEVIYVTMTDDRLGTSDPEMWPERLALIRMREQEEAAKILGVKELIWLNYRDGELYPSLKAREELIHLIRLYRPDMVITVDPWLSYEAHPDHRATGILAAEAVMFSPFPHAVPGDLRKGVKPHHVRYIAFYWTRRPNVYIDVTKYIDLKLKAVRAHKSQFEANWPVFEQLLRASLRLMGKRAGVGYAEAFKVLSPQYLHCNVFAEDM